MKKLPIGFQIRQGDVLLTKIAHSPKAKGKTQKRDRGFVVLAYGEATGHAHVLEEKGVELIEIEDVGDMVVTAEGISILRHIDIRTRTPSPDHDDVEIDKGKWKVTRQTEYTPQGLRNVID